MSIPDWLKRAWIFSYKGRKLSLLDYSVDDVDIEEIAHALSLTCRFGGHCKKFYSVAEHSVIVSHIMEEMGYSTKLQLAGLLHDAAEYILTDVPKPFKHLIKDYDKYESNIMSVIQDKFDIDTNYPIIKLIDLDMVVSEAVHLFLKPPTWIKDHPGMLLRDFKTKHLACHDPEAAEFAFMERYRELTQ